MAHTKITFNNTVNQSAQVGDMVYISDVLTGGITSEPKQAGKILEVAQNHIIIDKDVNVVPVITSGMFILFSKPIEVNNSSLKGYYADVTFENYSNKYAELYAISSEASLSSK